LAQAPADVNFLKNLRRSNLAGEWVKEHKTGACQVGQKEDTMLVFGQSPPSFFLLISEFYP
ncbi:MAG: hypothetical protein PUG73_06000, partial [Pseudomonadota bacterium]|nr:hypothetical protein [Pseudomonadota bacterium]